RHGPSKINVGVGAYRDDNAKPWVLPVVKKAEQLVVNNAQLDHEYLPIEGLQSFTDGAAKLIYGATRLPSQRAALLASRPSRARVPFASAPTFSTGHASRLRAAPNGSIVVLHACARNPTGNHVPFFDCAYQGFASGDVDRDAHAVRYFATRMELLCAQSFAKNFGLYNERCGNLSVVASTPQVAGSVRSQMAKLQRAAISNPPAFGARVVSTVLNDAQLYKEWTDNLKEMSGRIQLMRTMLFDALQKLGTPGSWQHILDQIGMFSFTGLTPGQSRTMKEKFHVYMTENGRISMAGLTTKNIDYFAKSLDWVVRNVQ
ncbi:pyridoxal phosphate-dependent transferase, partial [Catenaria anguillulae PL171]